MSRAAPILLALLLASGLLSIGPQLVAQSGASAGIPARPTDLVFPELDFLPPERSKHRHVLPCGVVVYVVEDHELPLVDVDFTVRTGAYLEPKGKAGLASLTGSQMRAGGTAKQTPDDLDEELAFLAASLATSIGDTDGSAGFNCLTRNLDRVLDIFFDVVRSPRFDAGRLELEKSQRLQTLARRNDTTAGIESREWDRLIRGADFFTTDRVTKVSLDGLTREDLQKFHRLSFHPKHFIVSVSGDVATEAILSKLEEHLRDWAREPCELDPVPPIPKPALDPRPGTYIVNKPTVNQGRVSIGQLAAMRSDPDYHALAVLNQILGGGAFTSRITSRVRSDEGLAYTAASRYEFGIYYPGVFRAYFQSKSESVAKALSIVEAEIERIRKEKVSAEELGTAQSYLIGLFPRAFATPEATADTLASDEFTGRDPSFWSSYKTNVKKVTADDVLRVAKERLFPEKLVVLIVGNAEDIQKGGLEGGKLTNIALPDPLTLEYPAQ